jgi:phage terminase small subunit
MAKNVVIPKITNGEPPKNPLELKLTRRQELFVKEYLVDFDGTRAAKAVGYSEKSAVYIANENLRKPHIKAAIEKAIKKRSDKIGVTAEEIINELRLIGFANMADFVEIDEGGAIRAFPLDALAEGKSRIIKKVKEKRVIRTVKGTKDKPDGEEILDATYEFELCDKVKSLELLARHKGLLHDKTEVNVNIPITIEIVKFSE